MISAQLSNRLIFVFSLLGLAVSSFLLYEYNLSGPIVCPIGSGCDTVRSSIYSHFLGISIPILGVIFYLGMAVFSIIRTHMLSDKALFILQLLGSLVAVSFGVYLTYLEIFVIKAICFWCALSFIISALILLSVVFTRRDYEIGN